MYNAGMGGFLLLHHSFWRSLSSNALQIVDIHEDAVYYIFVPNSFISFIMKQQIFLCHERESSIISSLTGLYQFTSFTVEIVGLMGNYEYSPYFCFIFVYNMNISILLCNQVHNLLARSVQPAFQFRSVVPMVLWSFSLFRFCCLFSGAAPLSVFFFWPYLFTRAWLYLASPHFSAQ